MGRKRTYDRDQVLQNAMKLFWQKGYEGSHLDEILEATGMNRFSLYKEFGGKQQLFEAALKRYIDEVKKIASGLERPPLGLHNIFDYFYAVARNPFLHGCLILNTMAEKHLVEAATFRNVEAFMEEAEALIHRNLEAAKEQGNLSSETDTEGLAKTLMALDTGIVMHNILGISQADKERIVGFLKVLLK